jgi:hypothetical protein
MTMTLPLDHHRAVEIDEPSRTSLAHRRRLAAAIALLIAGAIAVIAGWIGATGTRLVSDQLSYIASSSLTGIFLLGLGSGLVLIDFMAEQQAGNEEIRRLLTSLLAQQGHTGPSPAVSSRPGASAPVGRADAPSSSKLVAVKGGRKIHRSDCPLVADKSGIYEVELGESSSLEGCGVCAPAVTELIV